jgi:hypothetical protein
MWSIATWCLAVAILVLGASAARSAWRAPELASRDRLGAHFRWHRRGWAAAVVGVLAAFVSAIRGTFMASADVDPSRKATFLQAGIDATFSAAPFVATGVAWSLSVIALLWLGMRHGRFSKDREGEPAARPRRSP